MCDTIARGVAALGNAYGGLLLVGVTDDRIVRGVKEKAIESVADHCAAKIEPPWVPEGTAPGQCGAAARSLIRWIVAARSISVESTVSVHPPWGISGLPR